MYKLLIILAVAALAMLPSFGFTQTPIEVVESIGEKDVDRIALIVSAENYQYLPKVNNSRNDGEAIALSLAPHGFKLIRFIAEPATVQEIIFHLDDIMLQTRLSGRPTVIFFYYAGHGYQKGKDSYIVPLSATPETLNADSLNLRNIFSKLRPLSGGISIVLIDACRTLTPLAKDKEPPSSGTDSGAGILLGQSTKSGAVAQSSSIDNSTQSPYSAALQRYLVPSVASIQRVLEYVGQDVARTTGAFPQEAHINNSLVTSSNFYLRPSTTVTDNQRAALAELVTLDTSEQCMDFFLKMNPASRWTSAAIEVHRVFGGPSSGRCDSIMFKYERP